MSMVDTPAAARQAELRLLPVHLHSSKMKQIILLLLFCRVSSPVRHSLKFSITVLSGLPNLPEFQGEVLINKIQAGCCNTKSKTVDLKLTWIKDVFEKEPQQLQWYIEHCFQPIDLKGYIDDLKQRLNQSEGVHILQRMSGCEWDDETEEVFGYLQYGYDGEDFLSLDLKTQTWIAPKRQAVVTKLSWDTDKWRIKYAVNLYTQICPKLLKMYLEYGKSSLLRTELPSVSLLQKSPLSPVSCHATGFYPDRAMLFWRKDGEELHEDVDQGEVLPNHDGTFQMSADLKVSSVAPEDWGRYDCVFKLSGVKEDFVIKLDKFVIKTNRVKPSNWIVLLLAALVALTLVSAAVLRLIVYKKKKVPAVSPPPPPDNLTERLNAET